MVDLMFQHRAHPFPCRDRAIRRPAFAIQVGEAGDNLRRFFMERFHEGKDLIITGSQLPAATGVSARLAREGFGEDVAIGTGDVPRQVS